MQGSKLSCGKCSTPPTQYIVIGYAMITHLRASEKQAKKTSSTHDRRPPMIWLPSTAGMAEINLAQLPPWEVGTKCRIATTVHAVWWWILAMIHRLAELPN